MVHRLAEICQLFAQLEGSGGFSGTRGSGDEHEQHGGVGADRLAYPVEHRLISAFALCSILFQLIEIHGYFLSLPGTPGGTES